MQCGIDGTPAGLLPARDGEEGQVRSKWWKEGFQLNLRIRPVGVALAAMYAIACWGARQFSLDQFYLPAGIRVAALLLCPPRWWAYLLLGEYAYFAQMRIPMVTKYGLAWAIVASALLMPSVALIVRLHRRMLAATTGVGLLSVAVCAAIVVSLINLCLSHLLWPTPPPGPFFSRAGRMIVGDFLGILTIAPLALLWARGHTKHASKAWPATPSGALIALMLALGLSLLLLPPETAGAKASVMLLMALPAIALTCMHGWRGAAIGIPLMNLLVHLTTPSTGLPDSFDPGTFSTQQSMAVVSIALLALGSTITHYRHQYSARDLGEKAAIEQARTSHVASEMDLRERALHLRKIGDGMDMSLGEVANWLQANGHQDTASHLLHTAATHSRQFREQASMIYPATLEHVGLYLALQAGGVREAWELTDRMARPHLTGDPCQLTVGLQLAAYRTLTEAVSLLLKHERGQLRVHARCGRLRQRRGILLTVSLLDTDRSLSEATVAMAGERLAGRPLAYDGRLQCHRNRVRIVLTEAATGTTSGSTATLHKGVA